MAEEFFWIGAEARLLSAEVGGEAAISKKRLPKGYRNPALDLWIRKTRVRGEVKLLREASRVVLTPRIFSADHKSGEILMEFVKGKMLKELVEKEKDLCIRAGKDIRKLHDIGVIHGDLTTSNIIVKPTGELCFVDFGLGYFSKKVEDKATDLVVFKKTFNATHSSVKKGWDLVMKGYAPGEEMLARMQAIEKRARYH
jgi:Kae1-associated kinase Bud32